MRCRATVRMSCKPAKLLPPTGGLLVGVWLGAGCATDASRARGINSLDMFVIPVALDVDPPPGPDAIGVTVYASAAGMARGLPITSGRMEIQMYDGAFPTGGATNAAPRRVWTFTPPELKRAAIKTSLGHGYRFTLRWYDTPPLQNRVTIVARYVTVRESVIQSAPTTIAVPAP